jgi:hypothetical protein
MKANSCLHTLNALFPGKRAPGIQYIQCWVVPRAGLVASRNNKIPFLYLESNHDPSVVYPVAYSLLQTKPSQLRSGFEFTNNVYHDNGTCKMAKNVSAEHKG